MKTYVLFATPFTNRKIKGFSYRLTSFGWEIEILLEDVLDE
jgi:hypothetical protein